MGQGQVKPMEATVKCLFVFFFFRFSGAHMQTTTDEVSLYVRLSQKNEV